MKETLTNLATGLIAKGIRYLLLTAGGGSALTSKGDGQPIDVEKLAGGIAAIAIAWIWSTWEDRVKKQKALEAPIKPI